MSDPDAAMLPAAVEALLAALTARGFEGHVVGASASALLRGDPVRDFEVATSAEGPTLLALYPSAVPLDGGLRRLMLPTAAGPVDLIPHALGPGVEAELARRDFTLHALALDAGGRCIDPFGGRGDLAARRLRCVGSPAECFSEDPLRRLRAVRWVATCGLEPDPALAAALPAGPNAFAGVAASRLRDELHALLLGAHVERGLVLLRESGLEATLASGVGDDAAGVVAALPPDLELRLAGWLRGARVVRSLRRLREPRPRVTAVERLLQLHPIDRLAGQQGRLARLARRAGSRVPGLIALRRAEIEVHGEGAAASARLARVREALEQSDRSDSAADPRVLALDGRAVMEILGCGPGPEVGRALRQLEKDVSADPTCNTREALRERLLAWRSARGRTP